MESQQMFSSPAAQSFLIDARMHRVFARQGTLVPVTPGWETSRLFRLDTLPSWYETCPQQN
jgi:hypothetical protein